ncbi:MAG: alanyl-tRNA editing protein [Arenicellales bacterium]
MTDELFREDSYLETCDAAVTAVDGNRVYLDRTVFYPTGGGQPGDTGFLRGAAGREYRVVDTVKTGRGIAHVLDESGPAPESGERLTAAIDWDRRYRLMRMHTCMHVLCSIIPFGVTGGSIRDGSARLDFDAPEPLDKEEINDRLNQVIQSGARVSKRWISDEELDAQPELVRTLSVQPPRGSGRVRLIEIHGVDLQPCGGTHLNSIEEIGAVRVRKIEKKGKRNRRITIEFDDQQPAQA